MPQEIAKIRLQHRKETKGTVVYGTDEAAAVKTVYVEKLGLPQPYPREIELTLVDPA